MHEETHKKKQLFSLSLSLSLCLPRSLIYAHCSALGPRRLANGKINTFYGQPRDLTVLWAQAPSTHTHTDTYTDTGNCNCLTSTHTRTHTHSTLGQFILQSINYLI